MYKKGDLCVINSKTSHASRYDIIRNLSDKQLKRMLCR